jgi:hypothetical protein
VDDVAQIALDVVLALAAVPGEDLQGRARRLQRGLGVEQLRVHQLGVAALTAVEQVDGVVRGSRAVISRDCSSPSFTATVGSSASGSP